jgi:hypothetical protein
MSAVHSPQHYTQGGIEAIDYIAAKLGPVGFRAYCIGNALKYLSRWQLKDGEQDLRKAQVYLGWAVTGDPSRDVVPETPISPAGAELLRRSIEQTDED